MKLIGLTGGIASGKSLVTGELRRLGITILDADEIYHELLDSSADLAEALQREFGANYFRDGKLDRKKLGQLVFSDREALARLNKLTHPFVIDELWERVDACLIEGLGGDLIFMSVPLLFEARLDEMMEETVVVYAPPEVQLKRLMQREKSTAEAAQARLDAQWPIERKRDKAGFVIDNSGSIEATLAQVKALVERLRNGERGHQPSPETAPPAVGPEPTARRKRT